MADEEIIKAERLKSRLLGLEDGYAASDGEIRELKQRIATLEAALKEQDRNWWVRLGKFRKALHDADLHGHYNLLQEHFQDEAGKWESLQAELTEARAQIEQLQAGEKMLEESLEAQALKFEGCPHNHPDPTGYHNGLCACSYDRKEHVCAHHAPQLKAALEENAALRASLSAYEKPVTDEEWSRFKHHGTVGMRYEIDVLLKSRTAKEKRGPCCKDPDYCDGECTCKICSPDLAIRDLEAELTEARALWHVGSQGFCRALKEVVAASYLSVERRHELIEALDRIERETTAQPPQVSQSSDQFDSELPR